MSASWVIREKDTGRVIFETFNEHLAHKMLPKYEAIPIQQYLASLNQKPQARETKAMNVNPKVMELAGELLTNLEGDDAGEDQEWDLACVIQQAIDGWFNDGVPTQQSMCAHGGSGVPESQGIEVPGNSTNAKA